MNTNDKQSRQEFYERVFWIPSRIPDHPLSAVNPDVRRELEAFVARFNLRGKKILEVGSGSGAFQDIVPDYTGADIVEHLRTHYHKPYVVLAASAPYPFPDGTFDALVTFTVIEHIPDIDRALREMVRVVKPGGVMLLHVAWQVRPWAAQGYAVRPWSDFGLWGKLIKASIPVRDSILFRLCYIVPRRLWRTFRFLVAPRSFGNLEYKKMRANYTVFWLPDSDACNSIDPHAMILWFRAHGCDILNYPTLLKAFFVRSGSLILKKL